MFFNKLAKLADKYALRGTCHCQNPRFAVKSGLLKCLECGRPVNKAQWNQDHQRAQEPQKRKDVS